MQNTGCCMHKKTLLSFDLKVVFRAISTKMVYEKPSPHIFYYVYHLQDSNRCDMEWHLATLMGNPVPGPSQITLLVFSTILL